ncbi:ElyC/SanA/YdcF family protein [Micropruina sp.]|uniref:ElyC/SanA/YdcF family protein n=1 Tax=Micropruina sp. TaxID=2737536 RepID=UPI0039E69B6E
MIEDRSRTSEQNLAYSTELLTQRGVEGPIAAVTSNFHAFRAALLMRRLGIAGYSVGAPTAPRPRATTGRAR